MEEYNKDMFRGVAWFEVAISLDSHFIGNSRIIFGSYYWEEQTELLLSGI